MVYCPNCGEEIPEDSLFCPKCGKKLYKRLGEVHRADWGARFLAWLIDVIIVGVFSLMVPFPVITLWPLPPWGWMVNMHFKPIGSSLLSFLYWTFLEGVTGQSIGKMVLGLKVTKPNGEPISIVQSAIQSIGKAFLLPIDFLIGIILYKEERLFNRLSDTIVIRLKK